MKRKSLLLMATLFALAGHSQVVLKDTASLRTGALQLKWTQEKDGWHISGITAGGKWVQQPSGA